MEEKIMKHLNNFEEFIFESINEGDYLIFKKIWDLSKEDWFTNGDDAPSEIIDEFEGIETEDADLSELVELTAGGPGYTDVWLSNGILISDIDDDDEISPEEVIEENRIYFADKRKKLIDKLANRYPIVNWSSIK